MPAAIARCAVLCLLALAALLLVAPGRAGAATKAWDGGCGGDTSWSCAGNWSDNVVPGAADTVTFSAVSTHNSTVDPGFAGAVATVRINPTYTGTISLTRSLAVSKNFTQRAGSFNASSQALTLKALVLAGGTFTASSGTTSVGGILKVTGTPGFNANGGTVDFGGGGGKLTCGGVVFNRVAFSHATGTKTVGSGCKLPLGNDPAAGSGGSIKLEGTLSGSGALTASGTLTLGVTGGLSGFSGLAAGALTVSGSYDFGAYSTFSVAKAFTLAPGSSFVAPSATASFGGNFTIDGGAGFAANGGLVVFDGTVQSTLSCENKAFNLVAFEHTAGRKIVGTDCSLPLGANPTLGGAGSSVTLNGTLSGTGTLTAQALIMNSSSSLSGFSGFAGKSGITLSEVSANFGSYSPFAVQGSYVQNGGTVTAPAGAHFGGSFTLKPGSTFNAPATGSLSFANYFGVSTSAAFNPNESEVIFDGSESATISCGSATFNLVIFSNTAGTKTVGSTCDLPLGEDPSAGSGGSISLGGILSGSGVLTSSGTLTLATTGELSGFSALDAGALTVEGTADFSSYGPFAVSGAFTLSPGASFVAPPGEAVFGGDFTSGPGSVFSANGGTAVFDGTGQTIFGSTTFNNFSKRVSSPDTLRFAAGKTQTVQGSLVLEGKDAGSLLALASTSPGTPWLLNRAGTAKVGFLSVSDSTNTGATIVAGESFNGGGNTGWAISGAAAKFVLSAQATTPKAGEADSLTITAKDAYGNTATSYAGSHNLTFGPVADSPSGAHATVADSAGTPTSFGTATAIGFTEGVATASSGKNGTMTLVKAGPASLTVSDGSITNGSGLAVTVSAGAATEFVLSAQATTPKAGEADSLTITAKDAYGNTATSYAGSHNLTFGPVADSPSGAHATVTNTGGAAINFGTATVITFSEGVATVSSGKNGTMTLVKAGPASLTVSDGSITNGSGLAVTVSPGAAAGLTLAAATTTPNAGEADSLTITAKDAYGNTATSYAGSHSLTFGPVADSPSGAHATVADSAGTPTSFGTATAIGFTEGVATASSGKNGTMTLVKAGPASLTVSDGSITNGSGLAVTVSPGAAARIAWSHATVSKGTLSSPCLFTCTGAELSSSGTFKANVSITDSSGNTVTGIGSGHTVSVTSASGTITGGSLAIATSGSAESTTQFTYASSKGGAVTLTAATAAGTVYTPATATMSR